MNYTSSIWSKPQPGNQSRNAVVSSNSVIRQQQEYNSSSSYRREVRQVPQYHSPQLSRRMTASVVPTTRVLTPLNSYIFGPYSHQTHRVPRSNSQPRSVGGGAAVRHSEVVQPWALKHLAQSCPLCAVLEEQIVPAVRVKLSSLILSIPSILF